MLFYCLIMRVKLKCRQTETETYVLICFIQYQQHNDTPIVIIIFDLVLA